MGRDFLDAQACHELTSVLALVVTQGFLVGTTERASHSESRITLGFASCLSDFTGQTKPVEVLHDALADEAQECVDVVSHHVELLVMAELQLK